MMSHVVAARDRSPLNADLAKTAIEQCVSALADQPNFIGPPLRRHLERLALAIRTGSSDTARHARRLRDAVDFVEDTTGRSMGDVARCIRDLTNHVLSPRRIDGFAETLRSRANVA